MDFWSARRTLDDVSWAFVNVAMIFVSFFRFDCLRWGLKRNIVLKKRHNGQRAFIIGNGPSVGKSDLSILTNEVCFSVNRGFMHPDYEKAQPKYHIIVDPKLADGTWPLSWLDDIVAKNPRVTFLLNSKWSTKSIFDAVKNKYRIHWLPTHLFFTPWTRRKVDLTHLTVGGSVVEQGIVSAIYMGCSPIYLLGFEKSGFFLRVAGKKSHFYGINKEDEEISTMDLANSCYCASVSYRRLRDINEFAKRQGVEIINLTPNSLVDFFPKSSLSELFSQ